MRGQGCFALGESAVALRRAAVPRGLRIWAVGLLCAAGALLFASPSAARRRVSDDPGQAATRSRMWTIRASSI